MTGIAGDIEDLLPPKPRAPEPSDCCGTGCCPCVHDIYQQDMKLWRNKCEAIKSGNCSKDSSGSTALLPDLWKDFKIIEIKNVSTDSHIYTLKLEDNVPLGLSIGQHLIIKQTTSSNKVITRQYTPISDLDDSKTFQILVKIYPKGRMTQIIKNWEVGDMVPCRGPFGDFSYEANSVKSILMCAGGTGIAPLYQIIKKILTDEDDETFIKLFYSSKSFSDILLRDELANFCRYWNFTMCHFLSEEKDLRNKRYGEEAVLMRLAKQDVTKHLHRTGVNTTSIFICGTKSFDKDMVNAAKDADVPEKNIFKF